MSIENSGIIPQEVKDKWSKDKKDEAFLAEKTRSTYTFANAELFRPFFDLVIKENKELQLPWTALQVTHKTFYVKVCDALKYLSEKDPKAAKYILLKNLYRISPEKTGIVMRKKSEALGLNITAMVQDASVNPTILKGVTIMGGATTTAEQVLTEEQKNDELVKIQDAQTIKHWKDIVTNFAMDTANENKSEEFEFANLNDDDKEFIANLFSGIPNMDYLFNGNKLILTKIKI
jgi:hypothetical protein